ncbi:MULTISPECIES: hypothetical protein [unclassified Undibacterium]|uniref:hypothetical protein n=1 Tax=unclassified Undibacterium TaxID=2630295 RepID=UPI002AC8B6EE|nr:MULTISPECIES: hypothetical protein [unclassified Undibacterium]MEB0140496.1 hypothetical protein [Undibacterium sp. CCC2.1]MEB0174165.1 hypothetical protein [Undibacterium sp. CCC1.1]MEB0178100.1 hypothetical protein [Undibacterium sp. CCC3.4]MEB0217315.1 hypothetical protein [Undibacterium sp. 5I2]WPX44626.1 hypothetical protein RHM61_05195 [Undibacterium sp. CCC3.4]
MDPDPTWPSTLGNSSPTTDSPSNASGNSSCAPTLPKPDPCKYLRDKVRDLGRQYDRKVGDLAEDQWDLYNRAYDVNPGADIAGKGTYVGHVSRIADIKKGLDRAVKELEECERTNRR